MTEEGVTYARTGSDGMQVACYDLGLLVGDLCVKIGDSSGEAFKVLIGDGDGPAL